MHHSVFFLLLHFFSGFSYAQDERYYRQILKVDLKAPVDSKAAVVTQFSVKGSIYKLDLNNDKIEETIQPQKRDGVDWIEIRNASQSILFESRLVAMGTDSEIYKLRLVQISPKAKALLVFLDEGRTQGKKFESTGRFYVLTFEDNNLENMVLTEGPHFFHEKEAQREQYWRRAYEVNVIDINGDGVREIAVHYNHIQRIMQYSGKGLWNRF